MKLAVSIVVGMFACVVNFLRMFFPPPVQRYSELHDMVFLETSAKNNKNVREAFAQLASEICDMKAQQSPQTLYGVESSPSLSLSRDTKPVNEGSGCGC